MILKLTRLILLAGFILTASFSQAQNIRGFYLQNVGSWLGDAAAENDILAYAQGNGFNYILFYDLGDINWNSTTEKNQLGAFFEKARNQYGITQIGGVVEYAGYVTQNLLPYNNTRSNAKQKFDVIDHEFEFWVSSSISNSYCSKFLSPGGYSCDSAGAFKFAWKEFKMIDSICAANNMISEYYLGWPNKGQMQKIASRADRIMISAYRPNDNDVYLFSKTRLGYIGTIGGTTKVISLFSSESSFMGPWLGSHPQYRPYNTVATELSNETASFKQNIDLQGYVWFTYKYMPKTVVGSASISAGGPTAFCPGGSVVLTANQGASYLWSPGGQTTQSITVTQPGSYTVRVTSSNGVAILSAPTVVSNSSSGVAVPTITATGPLSFCPGGSVTLTANSSTSYLWSNGATTQSINATSSGAYTVVANSGGCSGTSSPITVNANAGPVVPTVSSNGSLDVCPGSTLTLTSTAASSYMWSNGVTSRSIVINAPGTYTVVASYGPACSASSVAKTVTFLPAPAVPVISANSSTILTGSHPSVTLTSSYANSYYWTNASVSRSITVSTQGSYRVTITGSNGCKATSNQITVKANGCTPPAAPVITSSGSNVLISGQNVTLTSSVSAGYLWSNGATTRTITVTSGGNYTVRAYVSGGCYSTSLPFNLSVIVAKKASETQQQQNDLETLSAYPNPAHAELNVAFNLVTEKKMVLNLIDLSGRVIQRRDIDGVEGENKVMLDVADLAKGLYFICILSGDERKMLRISVD